MHLIPMCQLSNDECEGFAMDMHRYSHTCCTEYQEQSTRFIKSALWSTPILLYFLEAFQSSRYVRRAVNLLSSKKVAKVHTTFQPHLFCHCERALATVTSVLRSVVHWLFGSVIVECLPAKWWFSVGVLTGAVAREGGSSKTSLWSLTFLKIHQVVWNSQYRIVGEKASRASQW